MEDITIYIVFVPCTILIYINLITPKVLNYVWITDRL